MRNARAAAVVLGCLIAAGLAGSSGMVEAVEPSDVGLQDRLVVHEWGTFTSYSGSDGARLDFRPLVDDDLPPFVFDRAMQSGSIFLKSRYRARIRMETPVTYFYTDKPRDVQVRVGFPQGLLTEFYPPVQSFTPAFNNGEAVALGNSTLDWGTVRLIPPSLLKPQLADERLANVMQVRAISGLLENAHGNHYAHARETDSAIVHLHRKQPGPDENQFVPRGDYFEKFLFYRGIGNFELPLQATATGDGRMQLVNQGEDPIVWMIAVDVVGEEVRFARLGGLNGGQKLEIQVPGEALPIEQLGEALVSALVDEGLFEREARAMVKTWESSWFGELGTRVLYSVPARMIDEMLPLEITPRPEETVRVLVGRLDIMTPESEQTMADLVRHSAGARRAFREMAEANGTDPKYPFPAEILAFGRLAEPALSRVKNITRDQVVEWEARLLLTELAQQNGWEVFLGK